MPVDSRTGAVPALLLLALALPVLAACPADEEPGPRLDPLSITKFKDPLVIPPAMPAKSRGAAFTLYEIEMRQFEQQVLPTGMPKTTVWGYGRAGDPLPGSGRASTFHAPSFTVEARVNETVRVKWVNGLVDENGDYLKHLLPVDQTLHWANPPGPRDSMGTQTERYTGPVPIVTHVHGAHTTEVSDGYPEAWYLPRARNLPKGFFVKGLRYGSVTPVEPGAAVFEYKNDQRAATLWYHDHALGITRVNVYAGPAWFWLLRDAGEDALGLPGPAPAAGDAAGTRYYEIPLAIQDRSFNEDGSLYYPERREEAEGGHGGGHAAGSLHPIWHPEVFGDTLIVNGRTWPYLEVEPRLYRFRLLNGCNSRVLVLKLDRAGLTLQQIGSDGGLLPGAPVTHTQLTLAPAERADVLVDFSSLKPGDEVRLLNLGPDEPYKGPKPKETQDPADPETTGQVMKFKLVPRTTQGKAGAVPASLPTIAPLSTTLAARDITLNEMMDKEKDVPKAALLGTAAAGPLTWADKITETPRSGDTEIWRIVNLTEDAHPVHLHLVMFQVLDRIPLKAEEYKSAQEAALAKGAKPPAVDAYLSGAAQGPAAAEKGWKDTVVANPREVTRIIARFDLAGLYVWHCHILEHEDNEMMRPYRVLPTP